MKSQYTFLALLLVLLSFSSLAATTTPKGKIIFTQGHYVPNCRTIKFQENATGTTKIFRINNDEGSSDIQSIILTALMSKRDVQIAYDVGVTTGCGSEEKILYVTVY